MTDAPDLLAGREILDRKAFDRVDQRKARDIYVVLCAVNHMRGLGTVCDITPFDLARACFFPWDYYRYESSTLERLLFRMQKVGLIRVRRERRAANELYLQIDINWMIVRGLPDSIERRWKFPDMRRDLPLQQEQFFERPRQNAGESVSDPGKMPGDPGKMPGSLSRQNAGVPNNDRACAREEPRPFLGSRFEVKKPASRPRYLGTCEAGEFLSKEGGPEEEILEMIRSEPLSEKVAKLFPPRNDIDRAFLAKLDRLDEEHDLYELCARTVAEMNERAELPRGEWKVRNKRAWFLSTIKIRIDELLNPSEQLPGSSREPGSAHVAGDR
jgi:hypothetical protein